MRKVYRIVSTLCVIALLTGIALGYAGYPINDTGNNTKNKNNSVVDTTGPDVAGRTTSTPIAAEATDTIVKSTTVKPTDTKPTIPEETPKKTPGFGMVIAIGVLSAVYILGKRR